MVQRMSKDDREMLEQKQVILKNISRIEKEAGISELIGQIKFDLEKLEYKKSETEKVDWRYSFLEEMLRKYQHKEVEAA